MSDIQNREDDYLPCDQYIGDIGSDGFLRFENEGKWYFALIGDGKIILRSEGYINESGRDNGIESVKKNMEEDDHYKTLLLPNGRWVLTLKAANHKEIARSCQVNSEAEAMTFLPSARAAQLASIASSESDREEDDYMFCREYEEKMTSRHPEHKDFIVFQHETTQKHYFAWVTDDNQVILRSEGYPSTAARDKGLESVRNNRENEDRYKIEQRKGAWFLVLRAGNNQEIGRSCPKGSEKEVRAWLPSERAKALAVANEANATATHQDDYLVCHAYEEQIESKHPVYKDFIVFRHEKTGNHYFAWVSDDNRIILRGEGYPTTAARDKGIDSVRTNRAKKERWKSVESHGVWFLTLRAGNNQEIGRSCPQKSEAWLWALLMPFSAWGIIPTAFAMAIPTVAASTMVAPTPTPKGTPPVATTKPSTPVAPLPSKGGFNWWWLLIPLVLLGLFMLWRSCNPVASVETEQQHESSPSPEPAPQATSPEEVLPPSCELHWILFDYNKADVQDEARAQLQLMADVLKQNANYYGELKAYTDSKGSLEYNAILSQRRAQAALDILIQMGIDASRIRLSANAYDDPIATNTNDDSGRKFNRRVELYVVDAAGKEVCKSIPPAVPVNLKTN